MNNILGIYQNGNYSVTIYKDGTKVRENDLDNLTPDFPESMDIKITNYCDKGCAYCHENSTIDGRHGDILNPVFLRSLRPFTELAIGGGNPLDHPDLDEFLKNLKDRQIIANITVNQDHFVKNYDRIKKLSDDGLITAIGVSVTNEITETFKALVSTIPNVVLHVIVGIITLDNLKLLSDTKLKILFLGYKKIRRGAKYLNVNNNLINNNLASVRNNLYAIQQWFNVISFDNLAIEQLHVRKFVGEEYWEEFYMGDDGQYTMYVDMINQQFANSSTSKIRYPLLTTIDDMFNIIRFTKEIE